MQKTLITLLTYAIISINCLFLNGMEKNVCLAIIPGMGGQGGENIPEVLSSFNNSIKVETPGLAYIDLGQTYCINLLKETLDSLPDTTKFILHGTSQGTATAINFTAQYPHLVKALILESVLLSGNSAIEYNTPVVSSIPGSYYIIPYMSKILFPCYKPAAQQMIKSINQLPKNLPIIIYHAQRDPQLSIKDAQALYAGLKNNNHPVYFFPIDSDHHFYLLNSKSPETKSINTILATHKIIASPQSASPQNKLEQQASQTCDGQPKVQKKWLKHFNTLLLKENNMRYIDWGVKTIFYGLVIWYIIT